MDTVDPEGRNDMTQLSSEAVADALRNSLDRGLPPGRREALEIGPDQNLLELVDSFGFAELVLDMETTLGVQLPLERVDLASIVHVDRLITFICQNSSRDLGTADLSAELSAI